MKRFVTLFPETKNVNLIKSNGMVPYSLNLLGKYKCKIVSYNNDTYSYLKSEIPGVEMDFLEKTSGNATLDGCYYLIKNANQIDILHIYHLTPQSFAFAMAYKLCNRKGIVYLKLDNTQNELFNRSALKRFLKLKAIKIFDVISSESRLFCEDVNRKYKTSIRFIPNGFYEKEYNPRIEFKKEKNILTVARIGTPEKANNVMVEGFIKALPNIKGWTLTMVGDVTPDFEQYMNDIFSQNPECKERIRFTGSITDRKKLSELYEKSTIFTLTSISEGFPTVFVEAIRSGCYILSTRLKYIPEEITDFERFGKICDINDVDGYCQLLVKACNNYDQIINMQCEIKQYAYENYYWPNTAKKLDALIEEAIKN